MMLFVFWENYFSANNTGFCISLVTILTILEIKV